VSVEPYITKTEQLFANGCPYNNHSQGPAKRLLFVCTAGLLRSPTAAAEAIKRGYNARSCGSNLKLALIPISENLIWWADHIIFMNEDNEYSVRKHLANTNHDLLDEAHTKAHCWRIPDDYNYGDEGLLWLLDRKFKVFESLERDYK